MYQIKQMKQFYVIYSNLSILKLERDIYHKLETAFIVQFRRLKSHRKEIKVEEGHTCTTLTSTSH